MKKLLVATIITLFASPLYAGSREFSSCDMFVKEAVEAFDWRTHEDDYNQVNLVNAKRSVVKGKVYFTYYVIAGYKVSKPNKMNSTYKVTVRKMDDCDKKPYCTKLFCQIGRIDEVRKRR